MVGFYLDAFKGARGLITWHIVNLAFSHTLKKLETYLRLTEYLRVYVSWYAQTSSSLQNRKILLLKSASTKEKSRKNFVKRTFVSQSTQSEIQFYEHLQSIFSKESFLRHFEDLRKLFIDVNTFKKRDIDVMIFHIKKNLDQEIHFKRADIESIMFLNKILTFAETRYWFTKLKMIDVVWIIKKVRHLIESSKRSLAIIFTNHSAFAEIIKQTFLISFNTNKLNLRLIRASQYLSTLSIEIRVKSKKFHVISDALSRLFSIMNKNESQKDDEVLKDMKYDLNAMLIQSISECKISSFDIRSVYISEYLNIWFGQDEILIEMTDEFRKTLRRVYDENSQWSKLRQKLDDRKCSQNTSNDMKFVIRNNLIYYVSEEKTSRLCISWSKERDIYEMTHDNNHHCDFHRAYARIFEFLYIRHMIKRLRRYIHHCRFCLKKQTKRHLSYDELNLIKTMILFFHTIIIDFIVFLFMSQEYDALLTTTNKFFKRVNLTSEKENWDAAEWISTWLNALQKEEWKLFAAIISNKDSKFVETFWKTTFQHLEVTLHFTTTYHSSADEQSERTNQTIEIIMRYAIMKEKEFIRFISFIQVSLNNFVNTSTNLSSNEVLYEFKMKKSLNFLRIEDENSATILKEDRIILKKKVEKAIAFANTSMKIRYDSKRTQLDLRSDDSVYFKLHKEYIQSDFTNRKFVKQGLESVKIIEKVDKLVYRLEILKSWKIHSIISMTHLESASIEEDSYDRETKESESIEDVQKNIKDIYEVEKIVAKRSIKMRRARHSKTQYRVKWKEWENHHNQWIDATEMKNAQNVVKKFERNLITQNEDEQWYHLFTF